MDAGSSPHVRMAGAGIKRVFQVTKKGIMQLIQSLKRVLARARLKENNTRGTVAWTRARESNASSKHTGEANQYLRNYIRGQHG